KSAAAKNFETELSILLFSPKDGLRWFDDFSFFQLRKKAIDARNDKQGEERGDEHPPDDANRHGNARFSPWAESERWWDCSRNSRERSHENRAKTDRARFQKRFFDIQLLIEVT